jgi:hypothetical protein
LSDIFREVEEDVRRERFQKLWKQYGDYAIAAVAVVAIGVAGYKLWERYESQQRLNASTSFSAAQQMADSGNNAAAAQAFGKLAKSAPGGYAAMALLGRANALLASGNHSDAVALYKSIATKDSSPIANVARIRAAWAIVEFTPKSELETWLAPMTDPTSPWRYMAREILAYADYRAGAFKQAQAEYESLAADTNATRTLRGRTNAMAVFLKGGGDKNFGTVPRPAPPATAPTNNPKDQASP